ncbi:hypothetical protein WK01_30310 [Burkholderia cepacia]|nr:hypothetical protein WK01_30310 [Burkholderia cepacia]
MIQAWASHKSFRPKDGSDDPPADGRNVDTNWTDKRRSNDTHQGGCTIDRRTSRHAGYGISQVIRKRIEEHFGWGKTVGRIRQTAYRGIKWVDQHFKLTMLVSNLTRMARILTAVPQGATR